MNRYAEPLPRSTTDAMFGAWLTVVKRKECASIISLPKFDREYRANQFVSWVKIQDEQGIQIVPISLQSLVTERWEDIAIKLNSLRSKSHYTAFLVTDADWLLTSAPHLIPQFQSYVLSPYRNTSFFFFFEQNIVDRQYASIIVHQPLFVQNLLYQKLYEKDDILHFLQHMEGLYNFTLSDKDRQEIWTVCRGYIWLSTEALRHAHLSGKLSFIHDAFEFRLRAIWDGFSLAEKYVLTKVILGKPIDHESPEILSYFEKTGFILRTGKSHTFSIPILEQYIRGIAGRDRQLIIGKDNKIYCGTVQVDSLFSSKEKAILASLLRHSGLLIPREEIAKTIWGKEAEFDYSDWNLDQMMRRLRLRLTSLGFPQNLICTVKGKGFKFSGEQVMVI